MSEILQMRPVRFSFESNETKTSPLPFISAAPHKLEALSEDRAEDYDIDHSFCAKTTEVQGIPIATSKMVPDTIERSNNLGGDAQNWVIEAIGIAYRRTHRLPCRPSRAPLLSQRFGNPLTPNGPSQCATILLSP